MVRKSAGHCQLTLKDINFILLEKRKLQYPFLNLQEFSGKLSCMAEMPLRRLVLDLLLADCLEEKIFDTGAVGVTKEEKCNAYFVPGDAYKRIKEFTFTQVHNKDGPLTLFDIGK